MKQKRFYIIILSLLVAGVAWFGYNLMDAKQVNGPTICLFKNVSSLPCPACGSTRSAILVTQGELQKAALQNPLGFLLVLGLFSLPIWLLYDSLTRRASLFQFSQSINEVLKKPQYSYPLIILILINWFWNIFKGL